WRLSVPVSELRQRQSVPEQLLRQRVRQRPDGLAALDRPPSGARRLPQHLPADVERQGLSGEGDQSERPQGQAVHRRLQRPDRESEGLTASAGSCAARERRARTTAGPGPAPPPRCGALLQIDCTPPNSSRGAPELWPAIRHPDEFLPLPYRANARYPPEAGHSAQTAARPAAVDRPPCAPLWSRARRAGARRRRRHGPEDRSP